MDQQLKTLENEIKHYQHNEQKLNNLINKLKKEKEEQTEESQNLIDKHDLLKEELNAKTYQINDFKEKVNEVQARLVKAQHDLQSSQSDIINLEKELQLAKDNHEESKEKIKVIKFSTHSCFYPWLS